MINRIFAVIFYAIAAGLAAVAISVFYQGSPMTLGLGGAPSLIMLFGTAMLVAAGNYAWKLGYRN